MSTKYTVYVTPKTSDTTYGTEINITDYVLDTGLSQIRRGIDSTDYSYGVFFYDDVQIKCFNLNGYLNDENDIRSIFDFTRDKAKVRIVYEDLDGESIVFRGLINEEATRIDATKDEITFRILSLDSVIKDTQVSSGSITTNSTVTQALTAILNVPSITSVLTFSLANINPFNDFTIDTPSELENRSARESLNDLLLASNSVLLIDSSQNIIVRDRDENTDTDTLFLYGPYDLQRRSNVVDIKDYNNGKHRMFNSVVINDTAFDNSDSISIYGYRTKNISMPFVTDAVQVNSIGTILLAEFNIPKTELVVTVPTFIARSLNVLDRVIIDHPFRLEHEDGEFFPIVGQTLIDDSLSPLPAAYGSIKILPEMVFKVLEIKEDPKSFETSLKLRQVGKTFSDGWIDVSTVGIVGFAIVDFSTVG